MMSDKIKARTVLSAKYGAGFLGFLIVFMMIGSLFDSVADAGRLVFIILLIIPAIIARLIGLQLSDGTPMGAFPETLLGWVPGIVIMLAGFLIIGFILSYIADLVLRLFRKKGFSEKNKD